MADTFLKCTGFYAPSVHFTYVKWRPIFLGGEKREKPVLPKKRKTKAIMINNNKKKNDFNFNFPFFPKIIVHFLSFKTCSSIIIFI